MATDSGTYTDDTIARKRRIAEALMGNAMQPQKIEHWAQGLAQLARAGIGGYMGYQADQEGKEQEKGLNDAYLGYLSGGASSAATPSATPAPTGSPVAAALAKPVPEKIYTNDEPSPLDPPSGADRDATIRTILAEAGNQGPTGMNAVASVIRNRAVNGGFGGDTVGGVVRAPNQFEPWNTPEGRAKMAAIDPNSTQYSAAAQALETAFAGNDPTGGATNFFAPKAQAALGRAVPAWGRSGGQDIGDHRFFGGKPPQTQLAGEIPQPDPAALPQNAQPTQGFSVPGQSQQPDAKARIVEMLSSPNPRIQALGRTLVQAQMAKEVGRDPLDTEAKRLGIEKTKKDLDGPPTVQRVKQPDGSEVAVQWDNKTKTWQPLEAPKGGNAVATPKLTEQQSKDVGFYNRGQKLIPRLEQQDQALTDLASAAGGSVHNYFKSDAYRQAEQTGQELLAVILRKDTGAAVTPSEMERYGAIYLPRPGDDPATIQQKRVARQTAIEGLRMGLGPAEIIFKSQAAADAARPTPAPPATPDGPAAARPRAKNAKGDIIEFDGTAWVPVK